MPASRETRAPRSRISNQNIFFNSYSPFTSSSRSRLTRVVDTSKISKPKHPHFPPVTSQDHLTPPVLSSRAPRAGSAIKSNTLRPHVLAKQRIHAWQTPFALAKRAEDSSILSPEVIALGDKVARAGISDSTKTSYAAGILRFNQFCDKFGISEDRRMPASDRLIAGFLGHHMGKASGSCVKNWLLGLRAWHDLAGAPFPHDSRLIRFARAGARVAGAHLRRPMRNPITLQHMLALYFALDFSISFHCAIWAVACLAFWGCRRLGELTVPSLKAFNSCYHATRSTNILFSSRPDGSPKSVNFPIPWTNTTKERGATVSGTAQPGALSIFCPVSAMRLHLSRNGKIPHTSHLFAYFDDSGKPTHMVKSVFLAFCHKAWDGRGLLKVQGHSFRIGGAVELLIAGVTPEIVAALGGWDSLAFLIYWRRFEEILPTHILKAYDTNQVSRLKSTLDDYKKAHKITDKLIDDCISGIDLEDFE